MSVDINSSGETGMVEGRLLAVETSGTACSLALYHHSSLLAEHTLYMRNKHDEFLAENTRELLRQCGVSVQHLEAVAVSAGPGSFTGLRIGAAFAKGLCFDSRIQLIAVETTASLARAAVHCLFPHHTSILSVVPSHRDLVYIQNFDRSGTAMTEVQLVAADEAKKRVSDEMLVCGPGADAITTTESVSIPGLNRVNARFVGLLGSELLAKRIFVPADEFVPSYQQEFEVHTK